MSTNQVSVGVTVDSTGALTKIKGVGGAFTTLEKNVKTESNKIGSHFDNVGDRIARRFQRKDIKTLGSSIANSITALATGGSVADVAAAAGLAMGVSMATQFIVAFAEKIAGTAAFQAIAGSLARIGSAMVVQATSIGTTIGTVVPKAAAIAMAIWPALLVAAIVAGIVYLINNPEAREKIIQFGRDVVGQIVEGIKNLGAELKKVFLVAFAVVVGMAMTFRDRVVGFINGIIQGVKDALAWLAKLPNAIGNALSDARERNRGHDPIGDFIFPKHAAGGWVGLRGPELGILGDRGPEYISPRHEAARRGGMEAGHSHDIYMDGKKVADAVDERMYRRTRLAPARVGT